MLRQVVDRVNGDSEVKVERLRDAVSRAIEVLRAAVE